MKKLFTYLILLVFLIPAPAYATAYYIADVPTGSDSNDGLSTGAPFATFDHALSTMSPCGDTLNVMDDGGTFQDQNITISGVSCTEGNELTIQANSGDSPIINNSGNADSGPSESTLYVVNSDYIIVSGLELTAGYHALLVGTNVTNLTVQNSELHTTTRPIIRFRSAYPTASGVVTSILLTGLDIHDNSGSTGECVYFGNTGGGGPLHSDITLSNSVIYNCNNDAVNAKSDVYGPLLIEGNYIHDADGDASSQAGGIIIATCESPTSIDHQITIRRNHIDTVAISVAGEARGITLRCGATVEYNIIQGAEGPGLYLSLAENGDVVAANTTVEHNTIYNNQDECYQEFDPGSRVTVQDNICWSNGSGNDASDPTFVDPASDDFNLQAGSPAIDDATDGYDRGTMQAPTLVSCEATDANTVTLVYSNDIFPPLYPASEDVTKVAIAYDGPTNATETDLSITATNEAEATVSDTLNSGHTITAALTYDSVEDSALIGNSLNGKSFATASPITCTNSIGGAPSVTITQDACRFIKYDATTPETSTDWFGEANRALDTNITIAAGGKVILACDLQVTVGDAQTQGYRLWWDTASDFSSSPAAIPAQDACDDSAGDTVCATAHASANATTSIVINPDGSLADVSGKLIDQSAGIPSLALSQDKQVELRWSIEVASDADVGDVACFRTYTDGGSAIDAYTATPCLTVRSRRAYGF